MNSVSSRWGALVSLCASLPDIREVQQLLDLLVRKAAEFFGAEICMAFLRTDAELVPAAWVGLPLPPSPQDKVLSVRHLRRYLDRLVAPPRCRGFMSAPMVVAGKTIGELVICSLVEDRPPFTAEERRMLGLLAQHAAFVVQDARLLESARHQQEAVARIAAALVQEVELRKVAQTAVELAVDELDVDAAGVWKAEPEERVLEVLGGTGYEPKIADQFARLDFDAPTLTTRAATTRRTQMADDLEKLPDSLEMTRRSGAAAGMRSLVAAPLVARGRLMGVLSFGKKVTHHWTQEERRLVTTLADLLASAIFNAELYQESERRRLLAEAVVDNSPVAIMVFAGPEHRYLLANATRERITGLPSEKVIGRTFAEVMPVLARGPVGAALDRVYQTGESVAIPEYQYDFGPPTGSKDVSLLYAPLRGPDGRVEAVLALMLDITEQVAARRRLEELAASLRSANEQLVKANLRSSELAELAQQRSGELEATIANIADAVFVCDPRGGIVLINKAGREMIGVEHPDELRTLVDYIAAARPRRLDGNSIPRGELAISHALRGEVVRGMEEIIYDSRSGQDRYILVSAAPLRDTKGESHGAVEVQSDITRVKELDLLKDQFITVAAHEIKTPVTAIKGFAQTLARASDLFPPKYQRALETIVQQADRIDALVRDFLDVSRMRWGRVELSMRRLDLTSLLEEVVGRLATTTAKHRLEMAERDPVLVEGDRGRLEQVLVNLLDNAIKYSPQGGEIEVRVRHEEGRAVVSVRDQGVGIPKDRQAHVFERFYRAHIGTPYDYGGLGVGLYISREIIRRHGGQMWFESEEGKGSTFCLSLPLAPE